MTLKWEKPVRAAGGPLEAHRFLMHGWPHRKNEEWSAAPSDKAVEFVSRQPMPANPVQVSEKIAVGQPIPNNLVLSPIPDAPNFAFTIVNDKRLIIDPKTFVAVRIVE
ncbi:MULTISPECIES: DUF1236 domain-containing protein [unclassified Neorhizobium]|uniref:DUF1236 domain-containing protein n=1 Tax=unclassified Neorhizobium TaxID=2629175 RepID=UPI001FF422A2|nr:MULTISPECIES: DUF1236 domain-containing protein [unclassified Neorhizobium]MCJ9671575.1 DUF1236 domain-containing protein [Neorhizobium sp. SHOUNA12B]MCJ9745869.1 DUF1236 domain-containing protein [Neorhizobium sp. SHOUNA12A]